jgi:hypothetical protein
MRTKEELIEFLNKVVGEDYITVTDSIDIKPYQIGTTSSDGDTISGEILFKGEPIDTFRNAEHRIVRTLVDAMNYSYGQSIKDCLVVDPDMLSQYKMTRFKFT